MPKIRYEAIELAPKTLAVVKQANEIIDLYRAQGYDLTLRQLYYQFVSRDLIPNRQSEYKRLGDIVSKGRRAGLIDWNAIVDRTRNLRSLPSWGSPNDIVAACADQFRYDRWATQPWYVEVWFEKDALMGVFERAANRVRVPFFSCRGYTSDSEVWGAAQRLRAHGRKRTMILHFGDHDPSGIDMTRDIKERLSLFGARGIVVERLALNFDQIEEYQPPPNPAKETDSRFEGYRALFGDESWELDALEPTVLGALVNDRVEELLDRRAWNQSVEEERLARAELTAISGHYQEAVSAVQAHVDVDALETDEEALDEPREPEEESDD